jgi:uncharacterized protein
MSFKNVNQVIDFYSFINDGIVAPDAIYSGGSALAYDADNTSVEQLEILLNKADTGISQLQLKSNVVPDEKIPAYFVSILKNNPKKIISMISDKTRYRYRYNSEINRFEEIDFFFLHKNFLFHESQESEGTLRLIELWENLLSFKDKPRTIIIDEINEKLHPELSRFLLEYWIDNSEKRNQLIFTTHNDNLLEDDLLRRDEVWMVTKNKEGASELASLVEYKIEPGTNVQKAYLHGWFNGIPRLGSRRFYHTSRKGASSVAPTT